MSVLKKIVVVFLILVSGTAAVAQNCEWLNSATPLTASSAGWSNSVCTDDSNNVIVVGLIQVGAVQVGSYTLTPSSNISPFMVKYNENGGVIWAITASGHGHFNDVITDDQGNIYVVGGGVQTSLTLGSGIIATGTTFLAKYSPSGQAIWVKSINGSTSVNITSKGATLAKDPKGNIILGFSFIGTTTFIGTSTSFTTNPAHRQDICIARYSTNGVLLKAARFGDADEEVYVDVECDGQGNIYILGHTNGGFTFGSQNFSGGGMLIMKTDTSLNPVKGTITNTGTTLPCSGITVRKNGYFAVVGTFNNSINFGNNVSLTKTGTYFPCFVAYFDPSLDIVWAKANVPVGSPGAWCLPTIGMAQHTDYLYFGGNMVYGNTRFGSISIFDNYPNTISAFVVKLDTLGNFLWGFCNGATPGVSRQFKVAVDNEGNSYICGEWQDSLTVFNKSISQSGSNRLPYSAKISDYTISRGPVSSGPYCAGDTIIVPFTKTGGYNPGNEFIAELSDSAGNFDGGERELGRVKSTTDDTVKGTLPLFNVPTTNKYRIRIISTSPQVQSFYKLDLLRLLVYSKDTANAGPDTAVCDGQSIRLGTTGGSIWHWSPTTYMVNPVDSANRQPLIKPLAPIEYRIIISDSSGCGEIDTDYVKVSIRPPLSVSLPDTVHICKARFTTLQAVSSGGDSANYKYRWSYADTMWKVLDTVQSITVSPGKPVTYVVIIKDDCSVKPDTARVTVIPDTTLMIPTLADTSICYGHSVTLDATAVACDPDALKYEWDYGLGSGPVKTITPVATTTYTVEITDTISGIIETRKVKITVLPPLQHAVSPDTTICIGESKVLYSYPAGGYPSGYSISWGEVGGAALYLTDTLFIAPNKTTTYISILNDYCSIDLDTAYVTVTVRPPLTISVNADTTICLGEGAELRAGLAGGYVPAHQIVWSEVGGQSMVNGPQTTVNPIVTTTYRAVLTDNCTIPGDSAEVTVTVRQPLKININPDTTICYGESAELRAVATGGYSPNYKITWIDINGPWTVDGGLLTISPTVTTTYRAVLTDNCTTPGDSAELTVTVRPPLQITAAASSDSICANQTIVLSANLSGGYPAGHTLLWTADGGPWTSTQNPAADQPQTTTTYIARLSDNCSNNAYDTLVVTVLPVPIADFDFTPKQGCPPLKVTFTDLSTGQDTTLNTWKVLATEAVGVTQYVHEFTNTGTYTVGLSVSNALGCVDQKTVNSAVTVFEKPTAQFIAKPDIKEIESPIYLYHQSSRAVSYTWDFGDGNYLYQNNNNDTQYTYTETGDMSIRLIAQNNKGCVDTQIQVIRIFDKINCVIPNAFTPNNRDDLNPVFAPVCVGAASYEMTIFNRWGQVIQSCENCTWDGTFADKPVPPGVYLYKLIITAESKKEATSFGTVNVLR